MNGWAPSSRVKAAPVVNCPADSCCQLALEAHTAVQSLPNGTCWGQVGHVAGVAAEATAVVDKLRARLRAVAVAVAQAPRRPRVLSLEGLTPLVLGAPFPPSLHYLNTRSFWHCLTGKAPAMGTGWAARRTAGTIQSQPCESHVSLKTMPSRQPHDHDCPRSTNPNPRL